MIIDSHAHYAHTRFDGEFPCLCEQDGNYSIQRTNRENLFAQMYARGIVGTVEASIGVDQMENQLALSSDSPIRIWKTVGVHPTRCIYTPWKKRKTVKEYAEISAPIAIGETGLDYHYPRAKQHRLRQNMWFLYQLRLAERLQLPLILHIRNADRYALPILKKHKSRLHGGVVHCFSGDVALAEEYISLGFTLGIGGKLLCDDEQGKSLCETVKHVPLHSLLAETDAPFVLPQTGELQCSKKQFKKRCNSSLILPAVIRKIATLRNEDYETVESTIYRNTLRVFRLEVQGEEANANK